MFMYIKNFNVLNQAEHAHGDIDESADAMTSSIEELIGTIAKLMPNIGMVGVLTKYITEVVGDLDDYRPGSRGGDEGDSNGFGMYQSKMMSSTKEIARTAQDIVIKSSNEPDQLGRLASNLSTSYQELATDAKNSSSSMVNADSSHRIR